MLNQKSQLKSECFTFFLERNQLYLNNKLKDYFLNREYTKAITVINSLENFQKSDYLYCLKGKIYLAKKDTLSAIYFLQLASYVVPKRKHNHSFLKRIKNINIDDQNEFLKKFKFEYEKRYHK